MKRSPTLVRRNPLLHRAGLTRRRRRRPIRPESERKAALSRDAAPARDLVRDRDDCCVFCGGPGVDAHHRLPPARGGAMWDPSQSALSRLVWLCRGRARLMDSNTATSVSVCPSCMYNRPPTAGSGSGPRHHRGTGRAGDGSVLGPTPRPGNRTPGAPSPDPAARIRHRRTHPCRTGRVRQCHDRLVIIHGPGYGAASRCWLAGVNR